MQYQEIQQAPVFYPTLEEWTREDPLAYIERVVRPIGEKAGICKIVAPIKWRPVFLNESSKFKFPTRTQRIDLLDGRRRIRKAFDEKLRKYQFSKQKPFLKRSKTEFWFHSFSKIVEFGSGRQHVDNKVWEELYRDMALDDDLRTTVHSGIEVKHAYEEVMGAFEDWILHGKETEAVEVDSTDTNKRIKFLDESSSHSSALDGFMMGSRGTEAGVRGLRVGQDVLMSITKLLKLTKAHGALAAPDPDPSLFPNVGPSGSLESKLAMFSTMPDPPKASEQFFKVFADDRQCFMGTVRFQNPDKRWKVRYEKTGLPPFEVDELEDDLALALACGATAQEATEAFNHGVCQRCSRANAKTTILACDQCGYRFHQNCVLPEDRPAAGKPSKDYDWFCPLCMASASTTVASGSGTNGEEEGNPVGQSQDDAEVKLDLETAAALRGDDSKLSRLTQALGAEDLADFGFPDGESFTMEEYLAHDTQFRKAYPKYAELFATNANAITALTVGTTASDAETKIEQEFWNVTKGLVDLSSLRQRNMTVNYGNDLDTSSPLGSGFPTLDRLDLKSRRFEKLSEDQKRDLLEYAKSSWNLNNLPTSSGSLLQHIDAQISGVIVPWLYLGMTFSAFCFHVEDHNFASINFHHRGAPKSWWGTPAHGADAFESVAKEMVPELFQARPDLLQGIVTMFDPKEMAQRGVPMYHLIQRPGDFVLTFPRAYHGGFNHGFNAAEAVNFAGRAWLPYGLQAVQRYATLRKTPVIAHEALLMSVAAWCLSNESIEASKTARQLWRPFCEMIQNERRAREWIQSLPEFIELARGRSGKDATVVIGAAAAASKNIGAESGVEENALSAGATTSAAAIIAADEKRRGTRRMRPSKAWDVIGPTTRAGGGGSSTTATATTTSTNTTTTPSSTPTVPKASKSRYERTVQIMGRTQTLSSAFNGVPRCSVCRKYCSLSHVSLTRTALPAATFCVDHSVIAIDTAAASPTATTLAFVETIAMDTLTAFATKICERAAPVERWISRANDLVMGRDPFVTTSTTTNFDEVASLNSAVLNPPPEDYSFAMPRIWKYKASLDQIKVFLSEPAAICVEQADDWRREALRMLDLQTKIEYVVFRMTNRVSPSAAAMQPAPTPAQLDEITSQLSTFVFAFDPVLLERFQSAVNFSHVWETRAQELLSFFNFADFETSQAALDAMRDLDRESVGTAVADSSLRASMKSRVALIGWVLRVSNDLNSKTKLKSLERYADEYRRLELTDADRNIPYLKEKNLLFDLMAKLSRADERIVKYIKFSVPQHSIVPSELSTFVTEADDEFKALGNANVDAIIRLNRDVAKWIERATLCLSDATSRTASFGRLMGLDSEREKLGIAMFDPTGIQGFAASSTSAVAFPAQDVVAKRLSDTLLQVKKFYVAATTCYETSLTGLDDGDASTQDWMIGGSPRSRRPTTLASTLSSKSKKTVAVAATAAAATPEIMASTLPTEDVVKKLGEFIEINEDFAVYCLCGGPEVVGEMMIACEGGCNEWFHPDCVGLTPEEASAIKKFICSKCQCQEQRYCVCRRTFDVNSKEFMIACDECTEWYHPQCIGCSVAKAETQESFFCPWCCAAAVPEKREYCGETNPDPSGVFEKCSTCHRAIVEGLAESSPRIECDLCHSEFHAACQDVPAALLDDSQQQSYRCPACCQQTDEPEVEFMGRGFGFERKRKEFDLLLRRAPHRPKFVQLNKIIDSVSHDVPEWFFQPELEKIQTQMASTQTWMSKCDELSVGLASTPARKLWTLLYEYLHLIVRPDDVYANRLYGELLLRHLIRETSTTPASMSLFRRAFVSDRDSRAFTLAANSEPEASGRKAKADSLFGIKSWFDSYCLFVKAKRGSATLTTMLENPLLVVDE